MSNVLFIFKNRAVYKSDLCLRASVDATVTDQILVQKCPVASHFVAFCGSVSKPL